MLKEIAILIIVHQKNYQTTNLIEYLSHDFDLYVHVDKKCSSLFHRNDFSFPERIFFYNDYSIHHGRFNMIRAEILLMESAFKIGYNRYIIISGSDIPLITNNEIRDFFRDNTNEYLTYAKLPKYDTWGDDGGFDRIRFYYTNVYRKNDGKYFQYIFSNIISFINKRLFIKILNFFGLGRKIDYNFYGGSSWMNLTHTCLKGILHYLSENNNYINRYKYTLSGDEIFFQTIICNYLTEVNLINDDLRFIDWSHSTERPRVFRINDLPNIIKSKGALFARKFDPDIDKKIIEVMYDRLK